MAYRMKDVAEQAGVSTATVSHVINGTRYVSDELIMKVRNAMKQMGYSPNPVARSLRTQSTRAIGLVVPMLESDTSNLFFMNIAHGVHSVLSQHGYNLVLANSLETEEAEIEQMKLFASQMMDGMIVAPVLEKPLDLGTWLDTCPIVYIDRKPSRAKRDCVTADGRTGVKMAVDRLVAAGHRRIGYISGILNVSTSVERQEGYKDSLREHGLPIDATLIHVGASAFDSGWHLAEQLLTKNRNVTAVMISNNVLLMGAVAYLQEKNIQVPSELAIIGFDDYDWTRVTVPPLTVVKQPAYEMGKKAAEIILKRLENPKSRHREWKLPTELVIRGSG